MQLDEINEQIRMHCLQLEKIKGYCPPTASLIYGFVTCWNATEPGTIARRPCPPRPPLDPSRFVNKECWMNGTWFVHPQSKEGNDWTNYTNCLNEDELDFNTRISKLYVIGYSISLVTLLISLAIFFAFRSLKCTRIRIHIHLFLSFIMNNIMWVIWYKEVIPRSEEGETFKDENPLWCQVLEILLKYFLISNYMWMFCESLYLHISLVVVFVRDEVAWIWFLLIGWGIPFVLVLLYSTVRIFYYQDTKGCWLLDDSSAELILNIPVCITLALSLIFLINVLRVILTIMHPNSDNPAPARVKRAARAALILIPLFGLHYILIPFRPEENHPYSHTYEYASVAITSLQGLCVSCLFCFANQDVHNAILGYINRKLYATRWSSYQYTGAGDSAGVFVINGNNSIKMS